LPSTLAAAARPTHTLSLPRTASRRRNPSDTPRSNATRQKNTMMYRYTHPYPHTKVDKKKKKGPGRPAERHTHLLPSHMRGRFLLGVLLLLPSLARAPVEMPAPPSNPLPPSSPPDPASPLPLPPPPSPTSSHTHGHTSGLRRSLRDRLGVQVLP
jgi:hypothetical protein